MNAGVELSLLHHLNDEHPLVFLGSELLHPSDSIRRASSKRIRDQPRKGGSRSFERLHTASLQKDPRASSPARMFRLSNQLELPEGSTNIGSRRGFAADSTRVELLPTERVAQRTLLESFVNIFLGQELLSKMLLWEYFVTIERVISENVLDISMLRAVYPHLETPTSLVHLAARLGHLCLIQSLIQIGVSINAIDENGGSLLIAACRRGHPQVVEYLMANGADSKLRQKNEISPFHWMMILEDSGPRNVAGDNKARRDLQNLTTVVRGRNTPTSRSPCNGG